MGPVISKEHLAKVEHYIELGKQEGASLVLGGKRPTQESLQKGLFIEPTIFTDCHGDMKVVQEESFGPIMTIERFSTEEEAVALANYKFFQTHAPSQTFFLEYNTDFSFIIQDI